MRYFIDPVMKTITSTHKELGKRLLATAVQHKKNMEEIEEELEELNKKTRENFLKIC